MEAQARQLAELLKALANEHRLLLLCALVERPMNVGELHGCVPQLTGSGLSQHLGVLKGRGILSSRKAGQTVTYYIEDHRIEGLLRVLKQSYCQGGAGADGVHAGH